LTRIELVTFRHGRSTNGASAGSRLFQTLEPLTRIELVTFRHGRSTSNCPFADSTH
jgi:hypothetical protein